MLITAANSRQMAAKSLEARRAAKQAALDREALLKRLIKAEEERLIKSAEASAQLPANAPDDSYLSERLGTVRKQIAGLDAMIEGAADAQTIDRIASAIARLSELERLYAGRPLPGSRRPSADRPRHDHGFTPPLDS